MRREGPGHWQGTAANTFPAELDIKTSGLFGQSKVINRPVQSDRNAARAAGRAARPVAAPASPARLPRAGVPAGQAARSNAGADAPSPPNNIAKPSSATQTNHGDTGARPSGEQETCC